MTDDEVVAAMKWIDSIDLSTADGSTCEEALVVLGALRNRFDEALGRALIRLKPPLCSIHCHVPLRGVGS